MAADCPHDDQLHAFLDEHVEDGQRATIERHLETCGKCQRTLEQWLTPPQDEQSEPASMEPVQDLIARLEQQPPRALHPTPLAAGEIIGAYRIIQPIASGTTGVVYRAEDTKLGRQVAMKVLRPDLASSQRGRVRLDREARAAAALREPSVVAIHDVCIDPNGISYLIMELVDGGTLRDRIRSEGTIPPRRAAGIARQIATALAAAHDKGLIHRDLKSSNILLDAAGDEAKLTDFGLVRDLDSDSHLTRENVVAGTPAYMSPEQILNPHEVDHRADLYSLGVVLYEMLSGECPFRGIERMVLQQVLHDEPRSLRRQNDAIDRDLETVCFKAMSKEADGRYDSASAIRDDLDRWLGGQPIHARRVGPLTRARRWAARNAGVASLMTLSAGLLLVIAIGSFFSAIYMRSKRLEAARHAAAAAQQRDQSLETLRRLIFDVNELLEPGEVDLDEVQEKLLTVALDGIEQVATSAEDAGVVDGSTVAARNRLGDVLFRLNRLEGSQANYRKALDELELLSSDGVQNALIVREQLRTYQGLADVALELGQDEDAARWMRLAVKIETPALDRGDEVAEAVERKLSRAENLEFSGSGKGADKAYQEAWELALSIDFDTADQEDVDIVAMAADSYAGYLLAEDRVDQAQRVYQSLLNWTPAASASAPMTDLQASRQFARYLAYSGLADVADVQGDSDIRIKMLRSSVDALPREEDQTFHWSISHIADETIEELLSQIDVSRPEPWMIGYANSSVVAIDQLQEEYGEDGFDRKLDARGLCARARLIRMHSQLAQHDEANRQWTSLQRLLEQHDSRGLPRKWRTRVAEALRDLEPFGFKAGNLADP